MESSAEDGELLAERIARMPSGALRRAKRLLEASLSQTAEEQVAMEVGFILESFATDDFREGVTSFVREAQARLRGGAAVMEPLLRTTWDRPGDGEPRLPRHRPPGRWDRRRGHPGARGLHAGGGRAPGTRHDAQERRP